MTHESPVSLNERSLNLVHGRPDVRRNSAPVSNVLIEIGAAIVLYKRNFILLVEHGVVLLSNLQGLYEVRYDGGKLDTRQL